jgi:hypothetical protein
VVHLHRQVADSDAGGHGLGLGRLLGAGTAAERLERREDSFMVSGGTSSILVCIRSCGGAGGGLLMVQLVHCPLEERARIFHMSIHN